MTSGTLNSTKQADSICWAPVLCPAVYRRLSWSPTDTLARLTLSAHTHVGVKHKETQLCRVTKQGTRRAGIGSHFTGSAQPVHPPHPNNSQLPTQDRKSPILSFCFHGHLSLGSISRVLPEPNRGSLSPLPSV